MKKVLVVKQVPHEGLGIIRHAIRGRYDTDVIEAYRDRVPSSIDGYSALVVLGGPMGVYEQERYPFIRDEIRLIERALSREVPVLGVCFGSQLIARAAGARVYRGAEKEIGWYDVELTRAGAADRLFLGLPESFGVFQWHGDTFDVPPGAVNLAASALFPNQVIRVGSSAYGIQFHLEVTEEMIREWLCVNKGELKTLEAKIDPKAILRQTPDRLPGLHAMGRAVLSRFFRIVDAHGGRLICSCAHC
ncbi:MAG: type 1 glutamine amidotransferase [Thermodesulfobacteriota bacterium]